MNVSKNQIPYSSSVDPELVGTAQQPRISSATGSNGDNALPSSDEARCEPSTSGYCNNASSILDENSGICIQRVSQNFSGLSVATNRPELQITTSGSCTSAPSTSIIERSTDLSYPATNRKEFIGMLTKAFTDTDTTRAKRLISKHGAKYLSRCTCSFAYGNNKTFTDITPFALACRTGNLDIVEGLYVDQTQLNQTFECINGTNGRTALMFAAMYGHKHVVKQLLQWGADPQILDEVGHNVDDLNFSFNDALMYFEIEELLDHYREEKNLPEYDPPSGWSSARGEGSHYKYRYFSKDSNFECHLQ